MGITSRWSNMAAGKSTTFIGMFVAGHWNAGDIQLKSNYGISYDKYIWSPAFHLAETDQYLVLVSF